MYAFLRGLNFSVISSDIWMTPFSKSDFNIGKTVFCPRSLLMSLTRRSGCNSNASTIKYSLSFKPDLSKSQSASNVIRVSLASFKAAGIAACITSPILQR